MKKKYTKVRAYKDDELLARVKSLRSFKKIPKDFWLLGVASRERVHNSYDDKIYLFKGEICLGVVSATVNSGSYGFKHYKKWNKNGVGQIKLEEWYYDVWKLSKHKRRMDALIQVGAFKIIRKKYPNDSNKKWNWELWKGFNFHCNTYNVFSRAWNWIVGGWSIGCQATNDRYTYFRNWIPLFKKSKQKRYTYVLVEEF